MIRVIGIICVTVALLLELASYYKQIAKTLRTKRSSQVSSTAYMLKIAKYLFTIAGLLIYANWVGLGMEVAALLICLIAFSLIIKYKPKNWKLFDYNLPDIPFRQSKKRKRNKS